MNRSFAIVIALVSLATAVWLSVTSETTKSLFPSVDYHTEVGFRPVKCWFSTTSDWPVSECYFMQVPETYAAENTTIISFPVVVFRHHNATSTLSPVLHLGAGGPGAPMHLDDNWSVENIWRNHDAMSLDRGRDLIAIDPRGSGLAKPLLTCQHFVNNEYTRIQENLSIIDENKRIDEDYFKCIEEFLAKDINVAAYNSASVARDVETMRNMANIEKWVLVGVSYGTVYAQTIARNFPKSVESMILDSSSIPQVRLHDRYIEQIMGPYNKLFNYCDYDLKCDRSIAKVEERIWAIYDNLNQKPIPILFEYQKDAAKIPLLLNGTRFLSSLMQGIYGVDIFEDLPSIIVDLENGEYRSLGPYLRLHVNYMLDRTYGDVSAISHYCFDEKPFIDFTRIDKLIDELPDGRIRKLARISFNSQDYCTTLKTDSRFTEDSLTTSLFTPTLFLHGIVDTVTPLSSVASVRDMFKYHQLITFDLSHSIISNSSCAETIAGRFIANPFLPKSQLNCEDATIRDP